MQIDKIRALVAQEIDQVNQTIAKQFGTDVDLIKEVSHHIFGGGGKRLRPMVLLLSAKAFGYNGLHHIELAAVVELIHTATLIHDDIVDGSDLRRGKKTANLIWGNDTSVLVGDFLYSRAFQMMVKVENMTVMSILADAANIIAEGEVEQLVYCNNPKTTETQYMKTIRRKTATLFEAATQLGAVISNKDLQTIEAMAQYGMHLGMAFQLIDDALDYGASDQDIGKNLGDDLAEGKPTLPLIHVLNHGTPEQIALVTAAIENGKIDRGLSMNQPITQSLNQMSAVANAHVDNLNESDESNKSDKNNKSRKSNTPDEIQSILAAIKETKALEYTYAAAKKESDLAITALKNIPESPYKEALCAVAKFAVSRQF